MLMGERIRSGKAISLETLEKPLGRETDRPRIEHDVVVRGDQHTDHHEQHARRPLHHVDQRPVALEEAQEDAESRREAEEWQAEPRRVGQQQPHALADGLLVAGQCQDGAQDGPDTGRPADREGQSHREGAEKPGGLAADLELAGAPARGPAALNEAPRLTNTTVKPAMKASECSITRARSESETSEASRSTDMPVTKER